jgi:hypothetical protein
LNKLKIRREWIDELADFGSNLAEIHHPDQDGSVHF